MMLVDQVKNAFMGSAVSLEDKVAFLQHPSAYLQPVSAVKVIETHMSWVFLAGEFVYKLKKPVNYYLFDHRSLQSRWENSQEEMNINRQLAKHIYLSVLPLVVNDKGKLQIDGVGEAVDWLVKMKRIPSENMLDYAIQHGCVDDGKLQRAALLLADFYKSSLPCPVSPAVYIDKLMSQILFSSAQLSNPLYELPIDLIEELTAGQKAFVFAREDMLVKRIADNRIIDTHGDLRPEHICLFPEPAIIDRIEFSKDLRITDTAEELSFLAMECEIMGSKHAGEVFLDVYRDFTNDQIPLPLLVFYKIRKACLRAYLVARHVEEPRYRQDPQWLKKANAYLRLAEDYHRRLSG